MPALITAAGANPDKLDPNLKERFDFFRRNLDDFTGDGLQGLFIDEVLADMSVQLPESAKETLHKTAAAVKASAVDGCAIFYRKSRVRLHSNAVLELNEAALIAHNEDVLKLEAQLNARRA